MFYSSNPSNINNAIKVGEILREINTSGQVNIRGYDVPYVIGSNDATRALEANLSICGREIAQDNGVFNHIQFRWLQTVQQGSKPNRDRVLLDNVTITSSRYSTQLHNIILMDDFDNQMTIK